jgi:NADH-quinone oxidoreductase subunit G
LARRKSVSPHDSTGANLVVQVKNGKVMRVVPLENEAVNECWIADRDRFSYEALNSPNALTQPMIKQGGQWQTWTGTPRWLRGRRAQARDRRVRPRMRHRRAGSPACTVEELHLLGKLVRGLGSQSIDVRARVTPTSATPRRRVRPAGWAPRLPRCRAGRAFVVGSFLRKDHPLLAQRLRQAHARVRQMLSLHAVHDDWAMPRGAIA